MKGIIPQSEGYAYLRNITGPDGAAFRDMVQFPVSDAAFAFFVLRSAQERRNIIREARDALPSEWPQGTYVFQHLRDVVESRPRVAERGLDGVLEALGEGVRRQHGGMEKLLSADFSGRIDESFEVTGHGNLSARVRSRGDERTGHTKPVILGNANAQQPFALKVDCFCPWYQNNKTKLRRDKSSSDISTVVDFHPAMLLQWVNTLTPEEKRARGLHPEFEAMMPYTFAHREGRLLVAEALALRYSARHKEYDIDVLLNNHAQSLLTPDATSHIREGNATISVLKHSFWKGRHSAFFADVHNSLESNEYEFAGFATEFEEHGRRTTSMVYTAERERVHIIYDQRFGDIPFFYKKFDTKGLADEQAALLPEGGTPDAVGFEVPFVTRDRRTQQRCIGLYQLPNEKMREKHGLNVTQMGMQLQQAV